MAHPTPGTPYIPLTREILTFGAVPPGRCFPYFQNNSLDMGIPLSRMSAALAFLAPAWEVESPHPMGEQLTFE